MAAPMFRAPNGAGYQIGLCPTRIYCSDADAIALVFLRADAKMRVN